MSDAPQLDKRIDKRVLARANPAGLAWWHSGGSRGRSLWVPARHLLLLSERIVDVATGRCPRLIVTMPPRHGKSELISRFSPAWFLGRFPEKKVILASYADTFAAHWGRRARDVLKEEAGLFGVELNPDTSGGGQWELLPGEHNQPGVMVTAGVGGGITGKGADLLIIDDPVKNSEDAKSEAVQEKHWEWWVSTARTRLQPGAGVILVMTRWHELDLAGQLIANDPLRDDKGKLLPEGERRDDVDGDHWEVLNLPAYAEPSGGLEVDEIGRAEGEVLWPEMYDRPWMEQTEKALGKYYFSALYMQRPAPAAGLLYKRDDFRYYEIERGAGPNGEDMIALHHDTGSKRWGVQSCMKFQTVDVAASEKEEADATVVSTWLVTPERDLVWWHCTWTRAELTEAKGFVRRAYFEQKPSFSAVERLGHGLGIIQDLVREGLPIMRLEADTDKVSRALVAVARYEEHKVFHPLNSAWREDAEHELLIFPNGAHDDIPDTVAYAARKLPELGSSDLRHGSRAKAIDRTEHDPTPPPSIQPRARMPKRGTITGGLLSRRF